MDTRKLSLILKNLVSGMMKTIFHGGFLPLVTLEKRCTVAAICGIGYDEFTETKSVAGKQKEEIPPAGLVSKKEWNYG
jgi:hypothetical protein